MITSSSPSVRSLIILGSGAAGLTAAIYAARAGLNPLVIRGNQPGGQLTITTDVENFPGFAEPIQGPWLMEQMEAQARHCGAEIIADHITSAQLSGGAPGQPVTLIGQSGTAYTARSLIIATGASAKWLGLPSEMQYNGKGVSACATCDGAFYRNRDVVVVGGGNSAMEEAIYLANICKSVTVVHRRGEFRGEKVMQQRVLNHEKITVVWHHVVDEILGNPHPITGGVTGIRLRYVGPEAASGTRQLAGRDEVLSLTQDEHRKRTSAGTSGAQDQAKTADRPLQIELPTHGVFIAIGHQPNTSLFTGQLDMDETGYLQTRPGSVDALFNGERLPGIFAAGDVADPVYRQAVTAAGLGCMAALDANRFLEGL